jgi:hypothetical protein
MQALAGLTDFAVAGVFNQRLVLIRQHSKLRAPLRSGRQAGNQTPIRKSDTWQA